ncbi:MAG TPA: spherulation-specific family 4 protein [Actinomadura sp.]|nr:spherulation-specific family 4 protein [Actinomadura sp.]
MPDVIGDGESAVSRRKVLRDAGKVTSAAVVVPALLGAGGSASHGSGSDGPDDASGDDGPDAMLVPAYFHPSYFPGEWARLADPRLMAVVLNVHNGPGSARDPEFAAAVARVERAGGTVVAYIDTAYGARPAAEIEAEARRYRDWYGVADVFLDQVSAEPEALGAYRRICAGLRDRKAEFLVFNHGVHPDPGYAAVADLLVTFEGPWSAYEQVRPPAWTMDLPAERFCHLVYAVPPEACDSTLRLARRHNAGIAYVTDGHGANPWGGLSGYFERALTLAR